MKYWLSSYFSKIYWRLEPVEADNPDGAIALVVDGEDRLDPGLWRAGDLEHDGDGADLDEGEDV